jgi:hypothetical protein
MNMNKKYEITDEVKTLENGKIVHRIKSLIRFGEDVYPGDLGGFIESEDNLSPDGTCWIYNNAVACDHSVVSENGQLRDNSMIYDYAKVCGKAIMYNHSRLYGHGKLEGITKLYW